MTDLAGLPLIKVIPTDFLPIDRLAPDGDLQALLTRILVTKYEEEVLDGGQAGRFEVGLSVAEEAEFNLVGLEGFSLVLGGASASLITVGATVHPTAWQVKIGGGARIRIPRGILKPVRREGEEWVDDPLRAFVEIDISAGVLIDQNWNVTFEGSNSFHLNPAMVADSGLVIEGDVALDLSDTTGLPESDALGLPPTWRGVVFLNFELHLPPSLADAVPALNLKFENFHIGTGGVTGTISLTGAPGAGKIAGFPFEPTALAIELRQNCLVRAEVAGQITLAFFDEPLDILIGLSLDGNFTVAVDSHNGLITLSKPNLLDLTVDSIAFARTDGVFTVALSGEITPRAGGLDWPTFGVEKLEIDSEGHVRIEGGWLELRDQYVVSLAVFQIEISKIGFGTTEDGRRWIGFSGGVTLVEGLSAGASVEGLRLAWDPRTNEAGLTLSGIGVEFEVPDAVYFKGAVAMTQPEAGSFRFDGMIVLSITSINLEVEAQLLIGYDNVDHFAYFAIYLAVDLPVGIPLGQSGLGFFGAAGLFGLNVVPGRAPDEPWYAIQPSTGSTPSWYHDPPGVGVAHLGKWAPQPDSLAIGAGVTIGTVADNGFTFAGRFLMVISFPGPVLMLEGRANILKERASLRDEPVFRSLTVIDPVAGTFLAGLDARYRYDDDGNLIDISGGAEAFFDINHMDAWHLYLGIDEPRERRIRAEIFEKLFEADAYFMIDGKGLRTGAWVGYNKKWKFGPLKVVLEAWIEGGAVLSFKPVHFTGKLWLHGNVEASAFGFGFGLGADARLAADVSDPFHLLGEFSVSVDLPWPFKDISVGIVLEWGPEPEPPLLPLPLKEVTVEHFKVTTSWPLPANQLLLPAMDLDEQGAPENDGLFHDQPPPPLSEGAAPPGVLPVVPVDARPHLTFGRSVHDPLQIGVNSYDLDPHGWEQIGDPASNEGPALIRLTLTEISVDRWTGTTWQPLARKSQAGNVGNLFGAWGAVPQLPTGDIVPGTPSPTANVKLWLWSKSGFDFTRRTGGQWDEWFSQSHPDYPCVPIPDDREICCDFADLGRGMTPTPPWSCPNEPGIAVSWRVQESPEVTEVAGGELALCFPADSEVLVILRRKVKSLRILVASVVDESELACVDFTGRELGNGPNPRQEMDSFGQAAAFEVPSSSVIVPPTRITAVWTAAGPVTGLNAERGLVATLPAPVRTVELTISWGARFDVEALDAQERVLDHARRGMDPLRQRGELERIRLSAPPGSPGIAAVRIFAPQNETVLHQLCYGEAGAGTIEATTLAQGGHVIGRYVAVNGVIDAPGRSVRAVQLQARGGGFCLVRVCVVVGLDAAERITREEMLRHNIDELGRWSADDEVLPPWSTFRVKIGTTLEVNAVEPLSQSFSGTRTLTQYAYFCTEGPPGLAKLSVPIGHPVTGSGDASAPPFDSGVDDLTAYVAQTVPPTVPTRGEKPYLPRPVYRAYDVGVLFNENYVDQMYAMAGRDLALYLFDTNDEPARDPRGRLLIPPNRWGRQDTVSLTASEERWLRQIDASACLDVEWDRLAKNKTLTGDGHVLDADTVYEARLVPLLLRDGFAAYTVGMTASGSGRRLNGGPAGGWVVQDDGALEGPSSWVVREAGTPPARYVEQLSNISRGAAARTSSYPGGTMLTPDDHPHLPAGDGDQPGQWTDYRANAYIRSTDDDAIGLGVRMSASNGYLFYVDRELNRRRLVRLDGGVATILAETPGGYISGLDMLVSLEAIGDRLRVFVDGDLVFDIRDARHGKGRMALYCGQNAGGRFTDIQVDDLRAVAPVVYRYKFTSSRFSNFRHHLHSFRDMTFVATLSDLDELTTAIGAAVGIGDNAAGQPPQELEARAYDTIAAKVVGTSAHQPLEVVDVTRFEHGESAIGLLVRTGEPIDWRRTVLSVHRADPQPLRPAPPSGPKLIAATFANDAATAPNDESVTVLLGETADLTGWRIERRTRPGPDAPDLPDNYSHLVADLVPDLEEGSLRVGLAWTPAFQNLSELRFVLPDNPRMGWIAARGVLTQRSDYSLVDPPTIRPPAQRGAHAVGGNPAWADIRFSVHLRAGAVGSIGVLFRYTDESNYYRFALDAQRGLRHLVKRVHGRTVILFSEPFTYIVDQNYEIEVQLTGNRMVVRLDQRPVVDVIDGDLTRGEVGFYTYGRPRASFEQVSVAEASRRLGIWHLRDLGTAAASSRWRVQSGQLGQSIDLSNATNVDLAQAGAVALVGEVAWTDVRIETDLMAESPSVFGVVFRYLSSADHVRLLYDGNAGEWQLIQLTDSISTVLWSDAGAWTVGQPAHLKLEAIGRRICAWVGETKLVDISADVPTHGQAGVLSVDGSGARWLSFTVAHAAPQWEPWYTFGPEPRRVAGAAVRVFAGTDTQPAAQAEAGEAQRFAGAPAVEFRRGFPDEGMDLQLITAEGVASHLRRFLPDSSYAVLSPRILRAADGTGVIILMPEATPPGSSLTAGEYRLRFRFRRDNRTADPASLLLSQSGDTNDEVTYIDVPWQDQR